LSKLVLYRQEVQRTPPPTLWSRLRDGLRSITIAPKSLRDPELVRLFGGGSTSAGVTVNEYTALNYSAVWAAVNLIASQIASLPLILYKRLPNGGKERFSSHQTYRLLHDEWNPEMASMTARETLMGHVLTWGNGYAEIERDRVGRPVALWPLLPNQVTPFRDESKRLQYRVSTPGVPDVTIPAGDMLHIAGLGFDGLVGYSPIYMARESLGLGIAAQRFGSSFFSNGATLSAVLEHPGELGEDGTKNLRESIEAVHQGVSKAHRLLILEEGMKYQKFGVEPDSAQFLETRQFEVTEVARWFNIPPHKLRDLMRATFSNIEQQSIEFVTDTLRPWLIRWEQEINRKLISRSERNIQYVEHLVEGLLRGDTASRYAAYAVGRQWGWLSADDIRDLENMNPLPNGQGKIYLVPLNMTPADRIGEVIDAQVKKAEPVPPPQPPPASPAEDDGEDDARHEALILEIREGQRQLSMLNDALASQAQQVVSLDGKLAEAATTRAALAEQLTTAHGEIRARLEAEQTAHAEAAAALTSARAEILSRTDAWRDEKALLERQVAEKQAELQAATVEADVAKRSALDALRAEQAAELQRVADEAARAVAAEQQRATDAAKLEADRHAVEIQDRDQFSAELHKRATDAEARAAEALAQTKALDARVAELLVDIEEAQNDLVKTEADRAHADAQHEQAIAEAQARAAQQLSDVEAAIRAAHDAVLREQADGIRKEAVEAHAALVAAHDAKVAEIARTHEAELVALREAHGRTRAEESAHVVALRESLASATSALEQAQATVLAHAALVERSDRERAAALAAQQAAEELAAVEARGRSELAASLAKKEDHAPVISAHRALVADTMRRMIEREADRARRAQATPQKLRAWVDTFYSAHEDLCRTALLPVVRVHLAWMRSAQDASEFAADLARGHVEDSIRDLRQVLDEDPEEFTLAISAMLHRWETDRLSVIADRLMQKELDYARRTA
jgi:HK97 family phage portal protein